MPSFRFLLLSLVLVVGGVVVQLNAIEAQKMENYWWSSSPTSLPNGRAQKSISLSHRWKRDDGAILKEASSTLGSDGSADDDVTQINSQGKSKQNLHHDLQTFTFILKQSASIWKKANRILLPRLYPCISC